ncbi:MAG: cobalt-precorrin-5B (C(1))-methyltransferase CbiD [Firmicutes bacterium]|nr:cobalt-precorrin-5B (C(1))-methyltransferase CbiD [Bacillota bacterium]
MEEYIIKGGKALRLGYTTGSCAAAAAKAAAWMLLSGQIKEQISLQTPKGILLQLDVVDIKRQETEVSCAIVKDGGDDPDVTSGAHIVATVSLTDGPGIVIDGGPGVGRVVKRGLDQPVGAAAINSVPRKMIYENVDEVCRTLDYRGGLSVEISVPLGEKLARKTFNPRLGIIGGISILGTSGIVEPMSEQALVDTIRVELKQRRANGADYALLTPGNYGTDFIRMGLAVNPDLAVQTANFIGDSLDICRESGFRGALLVGHIGKLVKIAGGMLNTHSKYGDCRMEILAAHAAACGLKAAAVEEMLDCVACDDALRLLREAGLEAPVLQRIIRRVEAGLQRRGDTVETGAIVFSKKYGILGKTANADTLLRQITEE